jgi:hypothetical protein
MAREEDIAADVQLPPLQEMKQALSLDRLGRLTYNVLQGNGGCFTLEVSCTTSYSFVKSL